MNILLKKPLGWLPLAMSLSALLLIACHIAVFGITPPETQGDEGPAARLFQLIIAIQFLMVMIFAVKYLPSSPKKAIPVIFLQVASVLIPIFTISWLEM